MLWNSVAKPRDPWQVPRSTRSTAEPLMIPNAGGWLSAPLHTTGLIRSPQELLHRLSSRHGPTFWLTLLDGPSVISSDPAFVSDVFAGDGTICDAPNDIVTPLVGDASIVLAGGERHRRKRKMLAPPFHGARMRAYGQTIRDATERGLENFVAGRVFDVLAMTQRLSLEVILRAAFGVTDAVRVELLRDAITQVVSGFPAWLMFIRPLQRPTWGIGPWDRHVRAVARLRALLLEEIAEARRAPAGTREDVLALLLSARDEEGNPMPDDEIVDELRTLIIAGHETTAMTLAWALRQLHRNPDLLLRLRNELSTMQNDEPSTSWSQLPLLAATCDETLRMYPNVLLLRRRLLQDAQMGGHDLPAGTILSPSVLMTHHDSQLYPEPHLFRPERFMGRKYSPSEYMPFGGGNRRCLGAAFATFELQVALGVLISEFAFERVDDTPLHIVMHGVTTRASGPVRLRFLGRRNRTGPTREGWRHEGSTWIQIPGAALDFDVCGA